MSARFGRRRLILTAIGGFTIFSALRGASQSVGMIVVFRLGQGLFGAFLIPFSQPIPFSSFTREKRGQEMALFGLGVIVAPILGPTLGAILTEPFGWRAAFYVNIPVAAFAVPMMRGELEATQTRAVEIDWTGLALMVGAIATLRPLLDASDMRDWFASRLTQVTAITAVGAGAAFVLRALRVAHDVIDVSPLRDRSFAAANGARLGFGVAMSGAIAILPLFAQGLPGYGTLDAGCLLMPRGLAAGVTMVPTGSLLLEILDPRLLVFCGLLLTGIGNLMLGWLNLDAGFRDLAWPGIVTDVGMGLFFAPMSTIAFQNVAADKQDEASGIYGPFRSLGSSIGISLVGWQLATRGQVHWATLSAPVTPFDANARAYLASLGMAPDTAASAHILAGQIAAQAQMLAFQDVFLLTGCAASAMLPVVLAMQRPGRGAAIAGGASNAARGLASRATRPSDAAMLPRARPAPSRARPPWAP